MVLFIFLWINDILFARLLFNRKRIVQCYKVFGLNLLIQNCHYITYIVSN